MCGRCSINTRRSSRAALVDDLGYRGPALLFRAVLAARAAVRKPAFFKRAIDLGCGTGLAATAFAREVDHFIGIDLSPRMIERARATGLYAQLEVTEMVEGLRGRPDASADLILAADAMVYVVRSRAAAARGEARACAPAACWRSPWKPMAATASFSARACAMPTAPRYVRASIEAAGLALSRLEDLSARNEDNAPVPGLVVVAAKT